MLLLIFIYFMMGQLISKYEPLCQCRVSDTLVTDKALGPLFAILLLSPLEKGRVRNTI